MIPGAAFAAGRVRRNILFTVHPVVRLGALLLGLVSCLLATPLVLGIMLAALVSALASTGLPPAVQLKALRPWLPMVVIILLVHTLTTTAAAPMGSPSWPGLQAGLQALLRVGSTVSWLALYSRTSSLDDLVGAVRWWFRPLERLGFSGENLGLVLAIALGTAPVVVGEGRRIETVVRLRQGQPARQKGRLFRWSPGQWLARQLDRARIAVPLVETLGRRAEALSLSLRTRRPGSESVLTGRPPLGGLIFLVAWLGFLVIGGLGYFPGAGP